jgi:hypothetical protein
MRRWVCIIALLAGFSGSGYAWSVRPRIPVPVVRRLDDSAAGRGLIATGVWWQAS